MLFSPETALIIPLTSTFPPFVVIEVFDAPISRIVFISTDKVPLLDEILAFNTVVVASKVKFAFLAPV